MKTFWRILIRFCLWWVGLFGWIGAGNCPCCGQPACPHGLAGSGLLAALATLVMVLLPGRRRMTKRAKSLDDQAEIPPKPSIADCEEEHRHREAPA